MQHIPVAVLMAAISFVVIGILLAATSSEL